MLLGHSQEDSSSSTSATLPADSASDKDLSSPPLPAPDHPPATNATGVIGVANPPLGQQQQVVDVVAAEQLAPAACSPVDDLAAPAVPLAPGAPSWSPASREDDIGEPQQHAQARFLSSGLFPGTSTGRVHGSFVPISSRFDWRVPLIAQSLARLELGI